MLYREPKLLKVDLLQIEDPKELAVSVLYREPKLLKGNWALVPLSLLEVSVLYREPKLLKVYPLDC